MDWNRIRSDLKQPAAPEPGVPHRAIGRYTVVREIARGGMAVVYEAWDPQLRRRVALKVVRDDKTGSSLIERLHREAAAVARVKHPNIVSIHEVGHAKSETGEEIHYIAMDFVDGQTMAAVLPSLDRRERLRILRDVAIAVDFAHQQGVIHRDLKPQNVMLEMSTQSGSGGAKWQVYLTDFGLAHVAEGEDLTRTGTVMGTVHYMAPEQVRGETRSIGPWTDVWALGVVLYQALTDRKPFEGEAPLEIYAKIVGDDPVPPCRINGTVHPDLETICLKALEKEPGRRYATAAAFAEELRRNRDGEPIDARPLSVVSRVWRKAQKHRSIVLPVAVILVVATAAIAWAFATGARRDEAAELLRQSIVMTGSGEYDDALKRATRSIELNPGSAPAFNQRSVIHKALGRFKDAVEDATEAIRLDPSNDAYYYNRGIAHEPLGEIDRALEDYSAAIRLKTTIGAVWACRATIRMNRKDGDGALSDSETAIRLEPKEYRALAVHGLIQSERGRRARAIKDLEDALLYAPPHWVDRPALMELLRKLKALPDDGPKDY